MGKNNRKRGIQESDDDAMEPQEQPQQQQSVKRVDKKKKNIHKQKLLPKRADQTLSTSKAESRKLTASRIASKFAKKVNLSRQELSLSQKQGIFDSVLSQHNKKKVPRKQRKKQRYLIKKNLRKQLEEKLPKSEANEAAQRGEGMEEEKHIFKLAKFQKAKAIQSFKSAMGMGFSSIKQQLLSRAK